MTKRDLFLADKSQIVSVKLTLKKPSTLSHGNTSIWCSRSGVSGQDLWTGFPHCTLSLQPPLNPLCSLFQVVSDTAILCLLSFILAFAPAPKIRQCPDITGIEVAGIQNKLSLYADDILLTLSSPHSSLPCLLDFYPISQAFNQAISVAINVSLPPETVSQLKYNFPFQWSDKLPYLGIMLTPTYSSLFQANYPALIKSLDSCHMCRVNYASMRRCNNTWLCFITRSCWDRRVV